MPKSTALCTVALLMTCGVGGELALVPPPGRCCCFLPLCPSCCPAGKLALDQPQGNCCCFMPACATCFPMDNLALVRPQGRCLCFLPSCPTCHPVGKLAFVQSQGQCCCFLPFCRTCSPPPADCADHSGVPVPRRRVKRSLLQDMQQIGDSFSDPDGVMVVRDLDSRKQARRWRLTRSALASSQGQRETSPGEWHFWELWSGCANFSLASMQRGCSCGPSVDIRAHHTMPRLQLNLEDTDDVAFVWWLLRELKPRHVHVAPPCTVWGQLRRLTARRSEEEWTRLRCQAVCHLELAVRVMRWQHSQGLTGSFEQPPACAS